MLLLYLSPAQIEINTSLRLIPDELFDYLTANLGIRLCGCASSHWSDQRNGAVFPGSQP